MNWNVILAVSEVIGVIAVIASIIYLAIQVRQSTNFARGSMVHDTSTFWANYHQMLATDGELADIFVRGTNGEALTLAETLRLESVIEVYMTLLEDVDHQYKSKLYFDEDDEEDIIEFIAPTYRKLLRSPVGRRWWVTVAANSTTPSLFAKMDRIISQWDVEDAE